MKSLPAIIVLATFATQILAMSTVLSMNQEQVKQMPQVTTLASQKIFQENVNIASGELQSAIGTLSELMTTSESLMAIQGLSKLMSTQQGVLSMVGTFVFVILVILVVLFFVGKYIVGAAVEASIQELTPAILGCKTTFDECHVDLLQGRVHIRDMTIHNPVGDTSFPTDSIFHVDEIIVDLQMTKLFTSGMHTVEVDELVFNGAVVTYDKPSMLHNSNVADVIDNIMAFKSSMKKDIEEGAKPSSPKPQGSCIPEGCCMPGSNAPGAARQQQKPSPKKPAKATGDKASVIVHKIQVEDLQAQIGVEGMSKKITIADYTNDDLSKECDGTTIEDVVVVFSKQFAENVAKECV